MRGHITKRGQDSYTIVINLGIDPTTGKRKQQWVSIKGTKKDAERKLADLLHQLDNGVLLKSKKITFGELLGRWLADYVMPNLAPRTAEGYEYIIRQHLIPSLGNIPLLQLKPDHLQRYYSNLLIEGRCDGKGGLSAQSVRHHHMLIHRALHSTCKWGLVARNVADMVDPPHAQRPDMQTWDEDEVRLFLEAASQTPYYAFYVLTLYTGARRSEVLALRWSDVDLLYSQVYISRSLHQLRHGHLVYRQTKTAKSRRTIALPPSATLVMQAHREAAEKQSALLGITLTDDSLVFCHHDGSPLRPNTMTRAWHNLAKRAGVKVIRLHDARHTHASLMLKQGIHPKIVQERLGHATIAVTLDTYSHISPGLQEAAARKFDELDLLNKKEKLALANG